MTSFHNLSLRRKLTVIIMLTSTLVLLLACAGFATFDLLGFRREMVQMVSSLAEVVGNNTTAAIDFNKPLDAMQTLTALRGEPKIVAAHVHTLDGGTFATYLREGAQPPPEVPHSLQSRHEFTATHLYVFRPIAQGGERVGTIELIADLKDLQVRFWRYAGITVLVLGVSLLAAFALSSWLQKLVSDPILHLAQVARSVAIEKDYSVRAVEQSDDELGQLVKGFNTMLFQIQTRDAALLAAQTSLEERVVERTGELVKTHAQLLVVSREAGMATVATSILHNVGNVLNSVNVSADRILEKVRQLKPASLVKVAALLREHAKDLPEYLSHDPRGRELPGYLSALADQLADPQKDILPEVAALRKNVEHIREIVRMQQGYTNASDVWETLSITDLMEDAIGINADDLAPRKVELIREFSAVPAFPMEKHKVLQILINLLSNAKHALDASRASDRKLIVRIGPHGENRVRISVIDNGMGIPAENLTRIFQHGFTTRAGGHGFGLHSGAVAAQEMGGSLIARSEGPGMGAEFTLELPISRQGRSVCTAESGAEVMRRVAENGADRNARGAIALVNPILAPSSPI